MGIWPIRRVCEHLRNRARALNPLARGVLIWSEANFLLRQCCALLRFSLSGNASTPLTPSWRGKDDSAKAIINDNKPLAVALLGAEVAETVTARQPTSELDIIVDRIERSEWEVGEAIVPGASTTVDGVELAPYLVWRGHAVDPRRTSQGEAAEIPCAIIETKGPLSGNAMVGNGNCILGQ